ncbi:unnamed protein product, partial [Mesorhabditis spiculigera]
MDEATDIKVEFIPSGRKGFGKTMVLKQYQYQHQRRYLPAGETEYKFYWRCCNRDCPVRVATREDGTLLSAVADHAHEPPLRRVASERLKDTIREVIAVLPGMSATSIVSASLLGFQDGVPQPSVVGLEQFARREKRKLRRHGENEHRAPPAKSLEISRSSDEVHGQAGEDPGAGGARGTAEKTEKREITEVLFDL